MDDATTTEEEVELIGAREIETMENRSPIRPTVIFESIRRKGNEELSRTVFSLALSGLVAGIALGFSVFSEALLRQYLPATEWRPLVENLGYTIGFLIVILGQMQLFTENTITAVCPVLDSPSMRSFGRLLRLWIVVLIFNLIGAVLFGLFLVLVKDMQPATSAAILDLSRHAMSHDWIETMTRGLGAGWLIAALVWILPNAEGAKPLVIIVVTYLIALADFSHVIAGTTEASILVFSGELSTFEALYGFTLPSLIGNVVGGTAFFTILTWGQIRAEQTEKAPGAQPAAGKRRLSRGAS